MILSMKNPENMSESIFKVVPLRKQSFFQKLFKQFPEENAIIELNNLLATKSIVEITETDINDIENRHNINLSMEYSLNLQEFYAVYLSYCLQDKILSDEEMKNLLHLKKTLYLSDNVVNYLHGQIGYSIYKSSFEEAISDGQITDAEKSFLSKLENDLTLPKELVDKIELEAKTKFIQDYAQKIIADERLSPKEEEELKTIAANLNITLDFNEQTQEKLQQLKRYWALENLSLPVIQSGILLQKSECCYMSMTNVRWHELRRVRQSVGYTGYSTSFRVAKGFYLRSGSFQPRSYSTDQMQLIDTGTLYLTNKRLIFMGKKKNSNIRLDKILSITPYSDGIEIHKETGKSPILQFNTPADTFCIILERVLRER